MALTKKEIIDKNFKDSGMFVNNVEELSPDWVSSGLLTFDIATQPHSGAGGFPLGKIVEIFGEEESGKTTLALSLIASALKEGLDITFFDTEHSYNPDYAKNCYGIDNSKIDFSHCRHGQKIFDMIEAFAANQATDIIVIDSVHGVSSSQILDASNEDDQIAADPRMWSKGLKKINGPLARNKIMLVLINQTRIDIKKTFGDPNKSTGGKAIKFYSDMRIQVRKSKKHTSGKGKDRVVHGHDIIYHIKKNKVGQGGHTAVATLYYGKGLDEAEDIKEAGMKSGILERAGTWYRWNDKVKGQGKDNFYQNLKKENLCEDFVKAVKEKAFN